MKRIFWMLLSLLIFVACTPSTETAVSTQPPPETAVLPTNTVPPPIIEETVQVAEATAVLPTTVPTEAPTTSPEPTVEIVSEIDVISGRTAEGAFFLGDPNAPITHIDYSDFL